MKNTLIQIDHCHNMVIALYRDEDGKVRSKQYLKNTSDAEVRADILGVQATEKPEEKQKNAEQQETVPVSLSYPANTARNAKEEQAIKRTKYLAFLNKAGVHEFDNERSFAKIEAAYNKLAAKKEKN